MTLWTRFKLLFGRKVIAAPQDLQTFLETRSAYYVQKSITEYAQARANMIFSTLLGEKGFQDAYEAARWKAFPAGLAAVAEVLTGSLRERLGTDAGAATATVETAARAIVGTYPTPDFAAADFWDVALAALRSNLTRAGMARPRPAHVIAQSRASEIFEALPFHTAIKKHDFEMFRNTLSLHLAEIAAELENARLERGVLEATGTSHA